jgi:hypothetical protein
VIVQISEAKGAPPQKKLGTQIIGKINDVSSAAEHR